MKTAGRDALAVFCAQKQRKWSGGVCPRLLQGDCIDLLKEIPDSSVDLIATDPPYFQGITHNGQKAAFNDLFVCKPFFERLAQEFKRILKPDGEFYIFTDWRGYSFYYPIYSADLPVKNLIVWDKISGAGNFYTYTHEFIIYGTMCNKNKKGTNVWREKSFASGAKSTNGEKVHPTQKPVELMEKIITNSSEIGGVVLDPFMGSGSTGVACANTGREFIGIELDERYFEIAKQRINDAVFSLKK